MEYFVRVLILYQLLFAFAAGAVTNDAPNFKAYVFEGIHLSMGEEELVGALMAEGYKARRGPTRVADRTTYLMDYKDQIGSRNATVTFLGGRIASLALNIKLSGGAVTSLNIDAQKERLIKALGEPGRPCAQSAKSFACAYEWQTESEKQRLDVNVSPRVIRYRYVARRTPRARVTESRDKTQSEPAKPEQQASSSTEERVTAPERAPAERDSGRTTQDTHLAGRSQAVAPSVNQPEQNSPELQGERTGIFPEAVGELKLASSKEEIVAALLANQYTRITDEVKSKGEYFSNFLEYRKTIDKDHSIRAMYQLLNGAVNTLNILYEHKAGVAWDIEKEMHTWKSKFDESERECARDTARAVCNFNWYDHDYAYHLSANSTHKASSYSLRRRKMSPFEANEKRQQVAKRKAVLSAAKTVSAEPDQCRRTEIWSARFSAEYPDLGGIGSPSYNRMRLEIAPTAFRAFTDETFVSVFGKPYDAMTDEERNDAFVRIIQSCLDLRKLSPVDRELISGPFDPKYMHLRKEIYIPYMVPLLPRYREAKALEKREAGTLFQLAEQADAESFEAIGQLERRMEHSLSALWPSERDAFMAKMNAAKFEIAATVLDKEISRVSRNLTTYANVRELQWLLNDQGIYMELLTKNERNTYQSRYDARLQGAITGLLAAEQDRFSSFGTGLEDLRGSTEWYKNFNRNYKAIFDHPGVTETERLFLIKRREILSGSTDALRAQLQNARDDDELEQIEDVYLVMAIDRDSQAYALAQSDIQKKQAEFDRARELTKYSERERGLMTDFAVLSVPEQYSEPTAEEMRFALMRAHSNRYGGRIKDPHTVYTQATDALLGSAGVLLGINLRFEELRKLQCATAASGGYLCRYHAIVNASYDDESIDLLTHRGGNRQMAEAPIKLTQGLVNLINAIEGSESRFVLTHKGWLVD